VRGIPAAANKEATLGRQEALKKQATLGREGKGRRAGLVAY
jgi:hypothetical protein